MYWYNKCGCIRVKNAQKYAFIVAKLGYFNKKNILFFLRIFGKRQKHCPLQNKILLKL
jgi:hypothetical protein